MHSTWKELKMKNTKKITPFIIVLLLIISLFFYGFEAKILLSGGLSKNRNTDKPNLDRKNELNKSFPGNLILQSFPDINTLRLTFLNPPDSVRPGVYWYFMDGNISKEGMTEDLEAMKKSGIGKVIFLVVNLESFGVPRGPVGLLSDKWLLLFEHAVREAKRLGIEITLGIGPGWTGSGGPWVPVNESMQDLVASTLQVAGPANKPIVLSLPKPVEPYFGEEPFTPELKKQWENYYEDVAVLAFPTAKMDNKIKNIDEKALYFRAPYSSVPAVKPFLPFTYNDSSYLSDTFISKANIIDLTGKFHPDGTLNWEVPPGNWTIMRFVARSNGSITRPAPKQGLGFECNKFDTTALDHHLNAYIGKILQVIGAVGAKSSGGLKKLHMDSWEMSSQNWTANFREEFIKRRGYDPLPFYPVYAGDIVESPEISERFLWDLRQTSQELVLDYHADQVKKYAHRLGLGLSIEPYDMNPTADLQLGASADFPMGEFWSKGFGFPTSFSIIEAASLAHIGGKSVVQAEAFTSCFSEDWKQYPGSMKNQGDWAFSAGINQFFFHTFVHQPWSNNVRPGMTLGPCGVHWDRRQTWWSMVGPYHKYISRCQFILQQGKPVADILYLTPEGAPLNFMPPPSSMVGDSDITDRRGYNFDGCSPEELFHAYVKDHQIIFPGGASYRLLILPAEQTMTPALLDKIRSLVYDGAIMVGLPPLKSPGLSGFPGCDQKIQSIAAELWGGLESPKVQTEHFYGKGKVIWGGNINIKDGTSLYPVYDVAAKLLSEMGILKDFESSGAIRYTHRTAKDWDFYFVSNRSDQPVNADCIFKTTKGTPQLWDPVTGKLRMLSEFYTDNDRTTIPLRFEPFQSFFIAFAQESSGIPSHEKNFPENIVVSAINGPWAVSFDPGWGGPQKIIFDHLLDWSLSPESGIKYYSGIAEYRKNFDLPLNIVKTDNKRLFLDLGEVKNIAGVKLNGHDLGVVWTAPWHVDITGVVKQKNNKLEISVANLWPNRMIGDTQYPDDGIKDGQFPEWLIKGQKHPGKRYTFSTFSPYKKDSPLLESGLLGPVTIQEQQFLQQNSN